MRAEAHESANSGGRGIEDRDFVLLDNAPEAVRLWIVRGSLIHHHGGAILERAVHNVAVSRDPADIGRAPVDVLFLEIEHPFRRDIDADRVAASGVQNAFWLSSGSE